MKGKSYVVAFIHEEKNSNVIADNFGISETRDSDLGTQIIQRIADAVKASSVSISAIVMDFFADMDPAEQGPFMATAMVAYYAKAYGDRVATEMMARHLRQLFGSGESKP